MKLSPIRRRDFIKRLQQLGWEGPHEGGKHQFMRKGAAKMPVPNPHGGGEISVPKLRELLREMGVTPEEWVRLK